MNNIILYGIIILLFTLFLDVLFGPEFTQSILLAAVVIIILSPALYIFGNGREKEEEWASIAGNVINLLLLSFYQEIHRCIS